jgi:acyl carrier protein
MTEREVVEQARAVLAHRLRVDPSVITSETEIESLGLDSLDLVTLAGEFEETFSVGLATKEIMQIRTFGDLTRQLSAKIAAIA